MEFDEIEYLERFGLIKIILFMSEIQEPIIRQDLKSPPLKLSPNTIEMNHDILIQRNIIRKSDERKRNSFVLTDLGKYIAQRLTEVMDAKGKFDSSGNEIRN